MKYLAILVFCLFGSLGVFACSSEPPKKKCRQRKHGIWLTYKSNCIDENGVFIERNDDGIDFETKAFQVCDKDGDKALDWQEVENCEKEYGAYVSIKELPDENDFKHFDTNKDGKLLFDEWLTQFNKQIIRIITRFTMNN